MCLAVPGKVTKIKDDVLTVEYPHEEREVGNAGSELEVGDYVLVQAKMAIIKLDPEEARQSIKAWEEAIEKSGG